MNPLIVHLTDQQNIASENMVDTNFWSPLFAGLITVLLGVGGFLAWSILAPLDAGVVADGTVTVSNNRKTIQHLSGGRIIDIHISEGGLVHKGQPLLTLDKTQIEMKHSTLSAQYLVAKSIEDRLLSERENRAEVLFSEKLTKAFSHNQRLKEVMTLQAELFETRRNAVQGEIAMLDESLNGVEQQIGSLSKVRSFRERQLTLINKELGAARSLNAKKYYPTAQLLGVEREAAELSGKLSEDILEIGKLKSQHNELKLKRYQLHHEYIRDVESELTRQQKEIATLEDELIAAKHELDNVIIRSPIDGVILDMKVSTIGGVVQPGEQLMDIVPANQPLQINAMIPVHAIDKLIPGMPVEILFPALNHALLPSIPGEVLTVSADRLVDKVTQRPYYLAEVQVTEEGVRLLGVYQIKAGMPASVTVKTGERTFMNYLLKPFQARLQSALKEI
ncbi:Type I secretion system membrane fusion protein PrsE [compost metagenome]